MVSACMLGHMENARGLRISPDSILQHAPLWEWCEDIKKI